MIALAIVVDKHEEDDSVDVILQGGNVSLGGVRMIRPRANPLYGVTGNLPDIGERGLIIHLPDYGNMYFWLGSVFSLSENVCTSEVGKSINHMDNGIRSKINGDGTMEMYHPSGTMLKIGSTTAESRTRQKRIDGKMSLREEVSYDKLLQVPQTLYIEHYRKKTAPATAPYPTDKRKTMITDAATSTKPTKITLDDVGNFKIEHVTDAGSTYSFHIDKDGNFSVDVPKTQTSTIVEDLVEIIGGDRTETVSGDSFETVTGAKHIVCGDVIFGDLGGALKLLTTAFMTLYNSHTHPDAQGGTTGIPNQQASEGTHSTTKVRAD